MAMAAIWTGMVVVSILCGLARGAGPQVAAAVSDKKGEALRPPLNIGNGSQSCMRKSTRILNKRVAGRLRMGMPVRAVMSSSVARSSSREGLMSVNQML